MAHFEIHLAIARGWDLHEGRQGKYALTLAGTAEDIAEGGCCCAIYKESAESPSRGGFIPVLTKTQCPPGTKCVYCGHCHLVQIIFAANACQK